MSEARVSPLENIETPPRNVSLQLEKRPSRSNHHDLIALSWENIDVKTPGKKPSKLPFCGGKGEEPKHIVKNVSGVAKPGSLMAIMGASGAGKTTLLNVLNYRNRGELKITGDVKINGVPIQSRAALASLSGYVQQEDLFIGTLKVKEQLTFQAMLQMDKSKTKEEKEERVNEIMNDLNLKKCENTLIGNPEKGIKGISGGERRRLAFGCELITDPMLMFCDEPTSGLDSFMALSIVESMRKLATQGKTIICTIHQPSSEVFDKFDRLVLMAEGRLAYIGDLKEAAAFFNSQRFPVPNNYNPADFYIQSLALVPSNREYCQTVIAKICKGFEESKQAKNLTEDLKYANSLAANSNIKIENKIKYKTNFLTQFRWLLWRSMLSSLRDPYATRISVIQTIFIAVLFGLIFLRLNYDQTGIQNINGVIFLLVANSSFSNMFAVLNTFPNEIPIFLREHQNGIYSVISYYISKLVADLPIFIILPFIFTTIIYWMSNLNNNGSRFIMCVVIVLLVANASVSFGLFISAAAPSSNAALGLSSPLLVPLMIFSGFFLNNSSVPVYFIWIRYLSWFSYAFELLMINQWDGVTNIACSSTSSQCFTTGADILSRFEMKTSNYAIDFIAMIIILIGWRVLTFVILVLKSFRK